MEKETNETARDGKRQTVKDREPWKEQEGKKEPEVQARAQHPVGTVEMTRQNHKKAATAFPCSHKGKLCLQVQGHPEGGTELTRATRPGPAGKSPLAQHPGLVYPHSRKDIQRR